MSEGLIWMIVVTMAGIALGLLAIKEYEKIKELEEVSLNYMRQAEFWKDQNDKRIDEKIQLARAVVDGRVEKFEKVVKDNKGRNIKLTQLEFNGNTVVAYRQTVRKYKEAKAQ
jgi:hypothetical protein